MGNVFFQCRQLSLKTNNGFIVTEGGSHEDMIIFDTWKIYEHCYVILDILDDWGK